MKKTVLLAIALFFGVLFVNGQITSQSSLFGGLGVGTLNFNERNGLGLNWVFGYQKNVWNEKGKIRFVPSLSFGMYGGFGKDTPSLYLNSTSLKFNLHFDVLKIKSFSFFASPGLVFNLTLGMHGNSFYTSSATLSQASIALNGLIGFRFNSAKKRIAYELVLLDGSLKPTIKKVFAEGTILQTRIVYKLLKTPTKDTAEKEEL